MNNMIPEGYIYIEKNRLKNLAQGAIDRIEQIREKDVVKRRAEYVDESLKYRLLPWYKKLFATEPCDPDKNNFGSSCVDSIRQFNIGTYRLCEKFLVAVGECNSGDRVMISVESIQVLKSWNS